jgi:hypothetical protein
VGTSLSDDRMKSRLMVHAEAEEDENESESE